MRGISRVAEDLLASKEGLCSMELVIKGKFVSMHDIMLYWAVEGIAPLILILGPI